MEIKYPVKEDQYVKVLEILYAELGQAPLEVEKCADLRKIIKFLMNSIVDNKKSSDSVEVTDAGTLQV